MAYLDPCIIVDNIVILVNHMNLPAKIDWNASTSDIMGSIHKNHKWKIK